MNNELLLLFKKHTDTLIEQTRTRPQETLEFKMNKQMQTFSFNPPINLFEKDKCFLAVSSFECTNSVFKITILFQFLYKVIGRPKLQKKLSAE